MTNDVLVFRVSDGIRGYPQWRREEGDATFGEAVLLFAEAELSGTPAVLAYRLSIVHLCLTR